MAKGKFAEYTIRGFEQAREQRQRENEFNRKMAEEQRQFGLLQQVEQAKILDRQRKAEMESYQYVNENILPYQEGMNLGEGYVPRTGGLWEQQLAPGVDFLPDDQQFIHKDWIAKRENPNVYATHQVVPDGEGGYRAIYHKGLKSDSTIDPKKKDLNVIREKVVSQFSAYQQLEDEQPKKLQFNLMKNRLRELVDESGIKGNIDKAKSFIRKGDELPDALQKASEGLSDSQKSDLELYFIIMSPKPQASIDTNSMIDRESFIKDFEKEMGRKPTDSEINSAKGEFWR